MQKIKTRKIDELSIFFPFWNEEKNINFVTQKAIQIADIVAKKWEILLIDDGSTDKTLSIANKLASTHKNIRVISIKPNKGYGYAISSGLRNSKYKYVVFTDGDRQFDFSEVTSFIEQIYTTDIVIGFRKKRRDSKLFKRLLLMNMLKVWDFLLFRFYFKDIDCGFKMFTREAINAIGAIRSDGAMVTTEILAKARIKNLTITQVGVDHYPRKYGIQSGANIFVIVRAVLESLILYIDIKNKRF